jgi:hypothetical protein
MKQPNPERFVVMLGIPAIIKELKSPKFIWAPCAQLYSLAETERLRPRHGLIYEGAIG